MNTYTVEFNDYSLTANEIETAVVTADGMQPTEGDTRGVVFYKKGDGNLTGEIVAIHYDVERVYLNVVETPVATVVDITGEANAPEVANA